jgi:hypothetical protein
MIRFLLLFLLSMPSACIVLPIPANTEKAYTDELLAVIRPGITTRDEVIEILGEAVEVRENDSIWLYPAKRVAMWIFAAVGYGGSGGGGTEAIYDYQHVVVEFDGEVVVHAELVEDESGCTSTGICIKTQLVDIYYISKGDHDRKAKEFQSIVGQCSVYVFSPDGWARFSLNSLLNIQIDSDLYLRIYLLPGSHEFRTFADDKLEVKLIECEQDELIFVEILGESMLGRRSYSVAFVTEDIGRQAINERTLYLSP